MFYLIKAKEAFKKLRGLTMNIVNTTGKSDFCFLYHFIYSKIKKMTLSNILPCSAIISETLPPAVAGN